jgi:hypothetical protein
VARSVAEQRLQSTSRRLSSRRTAKWAQTIPQPKDPTTTSRISATGRYGATLKQRGVRPSSISVAIFEISSPGSDCGEQRPHSSQFSSMSVSEKKRSSILNLAVDGRPRPPG